LKEKITIGVVGGSDLAKQKKQLGEDVLQKFDFNFPENGIVAYKEGKLIHESSVKDYLGEEKYKHFVNFCLHYIADLDIPIKRGTFIEFRTGLINVSPIGRNCSQKEREEYEKYDRQHKIREKFVEALEKKFPDYKLKFSIGGQISFDVFPLGWDKTYCLQHLEGQFDEIHFFGDKTLVGENDYEIFHHEKTVGHAVTSPEHTMKLIH